LGEEICQNRVRLSPATVLCLIWHDQFSCRCFLGAGAGSTPISLCLAGGPWVPHSGLWQPPLTHDRTRHPRSLTSLPSCQVKRVAASSANSFPSCVLGCLGAPKPKCCGRAKLNTAQLSLCFSKEKLKGRRKVFSFAFVISLSGCYCLA